ncbi:ABC transporter ATP-binding protein [Candidatus Peregrinibacteria bacterium]|nr:ABC transporter ATP-binding protein [Candidatus Peregrinibacteria bacterium]
MHKEPLLSIKDIKKDYVTGEIVTHALRGVDFEVHEGEFIAIMGHSGSGKSTMLHILGFLDTPSSGQYFFDGTDTTKLTEDDLAEIRNKKLGFVFQAFNLLPRTSALDNVRMPMIYAGIDEKIQFEKAKKALAAVGLSHRLKNNPNELSGGEQQRVAIARALINNPRLILADEPTGNLDSKSTEEIMGIFDDLHRKGHTIIIVTHEDNVSDHAEKIVRMKDGMVFERKISEKHEYIAHNKPRD